MSRATRATRAAQLPGVRYDRVLRTPGAPLRVDPPGARARLRVLAGLVLASFAVLTLDVGARFLTGGMQP